MVTVHVARYLLAICHQTGKENLESHKPEILSIILNSFLIFEDYF